MQKASLRSPFYILVPLLTFFFPPSPVHPKSSSSSSTPIKNSTFCPILPAFSHPRENWKWATFLLNWSRKEPLRHPSTKWQNREKTSANEGDLDGLCETSPTREAWPGRRRWNDAWVMKSARASHLLRHFRHEAGSICSAEELVEGSPPRGFCPLCPGLTARLLPCTLLSLET